MEINSLKEWDDLYVLTWNYVSNVSSESVFKKTMNIFKTIIPFLINRSNENKKYIPFDLENPLMIRYSPRSK